MGAGLTRGEQAIERIARGHRPQPDDRGAGAMRRARRQFAQQIPGQVEPVDRNRKHRIEPARGGMVQRAAQPAQRAHPGVRPVGHGHRRGRIAPGHHHRIALVRQLRHGAIDQRAPAKLCQGLVAAKPARLPTGQHHTKHPGTKSPGARKPGARNWGNGHSAASCTGPGSPKSCGKLRSADSTG
eukprot:gene18504-18783_t